MLKHARMNILHLALIALAAIVLPIEAYAAIPSIAQAAMQLLNDYAVVLFGVGAVIVLDTFAWPMLTKSK